jgi:hypothetical protein
VIRKWDLCRQVVQVHARSGNEHAAAIDSFFYVEQRGFPIPVLALCSHLKRMKGSENTNWVQKICTNPCCHVILPLLSGAAYARAELGQTPSPLQEAGRFSNVSAGTHVRKSKMHSQNEAGQRSAASIIVEAN